MPTPTSKLVTAIVARNEATRYLDRVIRHHARFGRVLVLDDHSTDDTPKVARKAGAEVRSRKTPGTMWGAESQVRKELWDWGAEEAGPGWLLIADADQLLQGDPRPLCTSWQVNTWSMPLYDCWDGETQFRTDGYWQGYQHPRAWLFRPSAVPPGWVAEWPARGIHCGHAPSNWPMVSGVAPPEVHWIHLAYVRSQDRAKKFEQYQATWDHMSPFEQAHAASILET